MTHLITGACVGVADGSCVDVCPVDCIRPDEVANMFLIDPGSCIDCGICVDVCPVQAIFPDDELPEGLTLWIDRNASFFG